MTGHKNGVESVAFSPDGRILASGSSDETIILRDVEQRQAIGAPLTGHKGNVTSVVLQSSRQDPGLGGWGWTRNPVGRG